MNFLSHYLILNSLSVLSLVLLLSPDCQRNLHTSRPAKHLYCLCLRCPLCERNIVPGIQVTHDRHFKWCPLIHSSKTQTVSVIRDIGEGLTPQKLSWTSCTRGKREKGKNRLKFSILSGKEKLRFDGRSKICEFLDVTESGEQNVIIITVQRGTIYFNGNYTWKLPRLIKRYYLRTRNELKTTLGAYSISTVNTGTLSFFEDLTWFLDRCNCRTGVIYLTGRINCVHFCYSFCLVTHKLIISRVSSRTGGRSKTSTGSTRA